MQFDPLFHTADENASAWILLQPDRGLFLGVLRETLVSFV
jgi:hypothetical protein